MWKASVPLRGDLLRWVPGRIPLALHAPGKAVERSARTLNSPFPGPWSEAERNPGPSATSCEAPRMLVPRDSAAGERGRAHDEVVCASASFAPAIVATA